MPISMLKYEKEYGLQSALIVGKTREGWQVIIVRALYGLKTSAAEWKKTFSEYIRHVLGYGPCI